MKKNTIYLILGIIIIILASALYSSSKKVNTYLESDKRIDVYDGTYTIAGQKVTLDDGVSEVEAAPGSASKIVTRYFGNHVEGDFNNDGVQDTAFIVTQDTGGSGIFYYLVTLLKSPNGNIGSEGFLLGDRIAPQTTEIDNSNGKVNVIVVNYADRKPGESFSVAPSVGKSVWLKLDPKTMQFGTVVQNFEGEADPSKMTLGMKTWIWDNTIYSDGKLVTPLSNKKFTITFKSDKTFSATTDCNSVGGQYSLNGKEIVFSKMMSTLMYCENSQESDFTKMLEQTQSYMFTSKGQMVLLLKYDSGSVIFK